MLVLLSQTAQSYPLAAGLVGEYRVMKWIKKCRPTGRTCLGPQIHNKIAFAASRWEWSSASDREKGPRNFIPKHGGHALRIKVYDGV